MNLMALIDIELGYCFLDKYESYLANDQLIKEGRHRQFLLNQMIITWSHNEYWQNNEKKFPGCLVGRGAPVKVRSDWKSSHPNLAASRPREILR